MTASTCQPPLCYIADIMLLYYRTFLQLQPHSEPRFRAVLTYSRGAHGARVCTCSVPRFRSKPETRHGHTDRYVSASAIENDRYLDRFLRLLCPRPATTTPRWRFSRKVTRNAWILRLRTSYRVEYLGQRDERPANQRSREIGLRILEKHWLSRANNVNWN